MSREDWNKQVEYYRKQGPKVYEAWMQQRMLRADASDKDWEGLADYLARLEKERITQIYTRASGNKRLTAYALKIDRASLYRKLKRFDIGLPEEVQEADERTPEQVQEEVDRQKKEDASREISEAVRKMEESIRYIE
jgi:hypothetical protein